MERRPSGIAIETFHAGLSGESHAKRRQNQQLFTSLHFRSCSLANRASRFKLAYRRRRPGAEMLGCLNSYIYEALHSTYAALRWDAKT